MISIQWYRSGSTKWSFEFPVWKNKSRRSTTYVCNPEHANPTLWIVGLILGPQQSKNVERHWSLANISLGFQVLFLKNQTRTIQHLVHLPFYSSGRYWSDSLLNKNYLLYFDVQKWWLKLGKYTISGGSIPMKNAESRFFRVVDRNVQCEDFALLPRQSHDRQIHQAEFQLGCR